MTDPQVPFRFGSADPIDESMAGIIRANARMSHRATPTASRKTVVRKYRHVREVVDSVIYTDMPEAKTKQALDMPYDLKLTHQSLPSEQYRLLLGTAISVFSSNNGFIIENVLRGNDAKSWNELTDMTSGTVKKYIDGKLPRKIVDLFGQLVDMRNRIIHGFRITNKKGEQSIATKEKSGRQFEVTEDYLMDFIHKNDELSDMLHQFRGY